MSISLICILPFVMTSPWFGLALSNSEKQMSISKSKTVDDCQSNLSFLGGSELGEDVCGDGSRTGLEQCDDGNTDSGDGCDSNCFIEFEDCSCVVDSDCRNATCPQNNACNTASCVEGVCEFTCVNWGDVNTSGSVNLDDILLVLMAFGNATTCRECDLHPCGGNNIINMDDILGVLGAFAGIDICNCLTDLEAPYCGSTQP